MVDVSLSIPHLGLSLAAGSLTTLAPCVFPLLPLFMGGVSGSGRWGPIAMGSGMVTSFVLVGLVLGMLGSILGIEGESVRMVGGVLLIALSGVMLIPAANGRLSAMLSPLSSGADRLAQGVNTQSLAGAFLLGALMGAVWSPCSGPLLASTLALVASEGGALRGSLVLGIFGLGAAAPLVAVAYASRHGFERVKERLLTKMDGVKKAFALLIGAMGFAIVTGLDKRLEAVMTAWLPDWWIRLTTGI